MRSDQPEMPLPTPVPRIPSNLLTITAETSRDTPVEVKQDSSISSSLTSFPEDGPLPTKNSPTKKKIFQSPRRKSTVEDTLNQIARDLRRQNKVLESYRKVLQQSYPAKPKKRTKKPQTKQAGSLKKDQPSTDRDHNIPGASRSSDISSTEENEHSLDRPSEDNNNFNKHPSDNSSKVVKSSRHNNGGQSLDSRRRRRQQAKSSTDSTSQRWHHID